MTTFNNVNALERRQFSLLTFLFQIIFIIIIGIFGRFKLDLLKENQIEKKNEKVLQNYDYLNYSCKLNLLIIY